MKRWEARRYCAAIESLAHELAELWRDDAPRVDAPLEVPDIAPEIERNIRAAHAALVDLGWKDAPRDRDGVRLPAVAAPRPVAIPKRSG